MVDFDLGQVRNAEAGEYMHHLGAMPLVVENHHEDRPTVRHGIAVVVEEGVVQTPLIPHPARDTRKGRVGTLVVRNQRLQRAGAPLVLDRLPGHQARPEVQVGDLVIERLSQRPVPDIELLIELRVGQVAAQVQELSRGLVVVVQQAIEQIHPMPSIGNALLG